MIRMLGQGSLGLISQTTINQWWNQKRGMVMGISGLLMALLGMGAFPTLVHWLIATFEWRTAYIILGSSHLLIMAPIGYFLIRDRPEDFGLLPDGSDNTLANSDHLGLAVTPEQENWTLKEALRKHAFWVIAISSSLFALVITGLIFQAISLIIATILGGTGLVLLFGVLLGITNGLARAVGQIVWPTFFGREHLGSIFGFTSAMGILGAAIGPLPFGIVHDLTGSYLWVLYISAAISLVLGIFNFTVQKPEK